MPTKTNHTFVKVLSVIVTAAGLVVMAGWIFDIVLIKSVAPGLITMKFSTAFAFVLSGISLYFLARAREGEFEKAQVALSITSFVLALLMGLLFFSAVFGVETGLESLYVKDPGDAGSVMPGIPSIPTIINFLLIAAAGLVVIIKPGQAFPELKAIGVLVGGLGLLAAIGYVFGVPLLYYFIPGCNSAMALHTALLFAVLGTGLLCLPQRCIKMV
ncbi:MAG TPA: hypothetical protein VKF42_04190 [Chitinivibrionales bacterium]|jgi:hypothetical protein|nr:hypothetical protein [Chitinivibrionales bacterium]